MTPRFLEPTTTHVLLPNQFSFFFRFEKSGCHFSVFFFSPQIVLETFPRQIKVGAFSYEPDWPGWPGYRDEFCRLFIWEISARSIGITFEKIKPSRRKNLLSFATIVALSSPVTLLTWKFHILLKSKYTQNYAILATLCESEAILSKSFVPVTGIEYSYGLISILVAEISVGKTEMPLQRI